MEMRRLTNSTCVQLCIPYILFPFLKDLRLRVIRTFTVAVLGKVEGARIPYAFKSVLHFRIHLLL